MKILEITTEEILGLLKKEKVIEHEIADWNKCRRDIRRGIQKIEDYLNLTSESASEQNSNSNSSTCNTTDHV